MKNTITILLFFFTILQVKAQVKQERKIDISIGYGLSTPNDNDNLDINGKGFYLQGEYVLTFSKWFDVRPYAGIILTKADDSTLKENEPVYKSIGNAFLFGGKTRISIPIPWIAPYIELGLGASIGSFETFTPSINIDKRGLFVHVPFAIGLKLGRNHNFDIAFTYYMHNSVKQTVGAAAFGISFPLN